MTNIVVVGSQWGDEGKGKVVDILASRFDFVIRYQGGHNAGHSVVHGDQTYALHLLPSGIFSQDTVNVIGNGVVVEPVALMKEINGLRERGIQITPANLKISDRAHMVMPYHRLIDLYRDAHPDRRKIGTTGRGIGPAYEWKAARHGIRYCDFKNRGHFKQLLTEQLEAVHHGFPHIAELAEWTPAKTLALLEPVLAKLEPHIADTVTLLGEARERNASLLFEGAQATLLDVDFGTYPYVTSSNSCAVGVSSGAGVPLSTPDRVVGIFKAYLTRVGEGPFPTELNDACGDSLRKTGHEYGTTTGRPRRCGWLDLVALRYAHRINGFHTLAMMKLDVLGDQDELKVCRAYELDGVETQNFPACVVDLARVKPVYDTLPGWKGSISHVRRYEDLPKEARDYVAHVEKLSGCNVGLVSVGPDKEETIIRDRGIFEANS